MLYRNRNIEDNVFTEVTKWIENIDGGPNGTDLTKQKLEYLLGKLSEKMDEIVNSKKREEGVQFKDLRIRICECCGEDEYDFPYTEIYLVWDESESIEERDARISKAKAKIDKEIEMYEKKKAQKEEEKKKANDDSIANAIEVLVKNGYTVSK